MSYKCYTRCLPTYQDTLRNELICTAQNNCIELLSNTLQWTRRMRKAITCQRSNGEWNLSFSNSRRVFYFFFISGCLFSKVNYKQVIWNIGYFFLVITGASCQWLWCGRSRKVMDINKVVQFTIKDSSSNHNQIIIRSR